MLALADSVDGADPIHVLVSFGEESEQDHVLGLTGLFLSTSWSNKPGYGLIERLSLEGETLTIHGRSGHEDVSAIIETRMMPPNDILDAIERCNRANRSKPENAV